MSLRLPSLTFWVLRTVITPRVVLPSIVLVLLLTYPLLAILAFAVTATAVAGFAALLAARVVRLRRGGYLIWGENP